PFGWFAAAAGLALYGVHAAAINTVPRAAVAHLAGPGSRGTMFGLVGSCALLGNVLAGSLWDWVGSARAMQAAGLLSLLALIPFALLPTRANQRA
ncbi:MAG: MFS transporter, partial [bacterium]